LLLSAHSARACAHLRRALRGITSSAEKIAGAEALGPDAIDTIIDHIRRLEIALRVDVGIYEVDKFESRKAAASYQVINKETLGKNYSLYPRRSD
jgi:hypothetical protein